MSVEDLTAKYVSKIIMESIGLNWIIRYVLSVKEYATVLAALETKKSIKSRYTTTK